MSESSQRILQLAWKNAVRWKTRIITIALLIGLTGSITLLYNGYVISATNSGMARITPIDTSYFDMLLLLNDDQKVVPQENLPRARYNRNILTSYESSLLVLLATQYGDLQVLGISEGTGFYKDTDGNPLPVAYGEILLPSAFNRKHDIKPGTTLMTFNEDSRGIRRFSATASGSYEQDAYPVALASIDFLRAITEKAPDNVILMRINSDVSTMAHLEEYMNTVYPGATQISNLLPRQLGQSMLTQAYQPSNFLLVFIYLFMGIGILTIALITFLERRGELATMKSIGVSNNQIVTVFGFEYGLAQVAGVIITWLLGLAIISRMGLFAGTSLAAVSVIIARGNIIALVVLILALLYPILIARAATVNQLLYARTIPLQTIEYNFLVNPTGALVLQEIEENVRVLRLPWLGLSDRFACIVLKQVGDKVKQGEIIASEELMQGNVINNFASICDGTVVAIQGALMFIKPDSLGAPRYQYPAYLIQDELQRRQLFASVRQQERDLIDQGMTSTEQKKTSGMQHTFVPEAYGTGRMMDMGEKPILLGEANEKDDDSDDDETKDEPRSW